MSSYYNIAVKADLKRMRDMDKTINKIFKNIKNTYIFFIFYICLISEALSNFYFVFGIFY
jgi:hypothetical protein